MESRFAIAGHPIHPMLVLLPAGLLVWTLAADLIYLFSDEAIWFDIARWSGIAAIIAALIAALPGFGDYLALPLGRKTRAVATIHMLLNLLIVAAFAAAAFFMFFMVEDAPPPGVNFYTIIGLHAFGVLLLLVSGWLGGEMVYRYHVGMIEEAPGVVRDAEEEARAEERRRARITR